MTSFSGLRRQASQIGFVSLLVLLLVVTTDAYTVVMRGGRRVEVPSHFLVTKSTLTYEVSQGIQITLAMAAIDIPATEKANNEQPGSLLSRAQAGATERAASRGARTITNRDLESSMRRRRESELAYEIRRKQLGLPTLDESRRHAAAIPDLRGTELEQKLVAERASEDYWRARASALRTDMAALDAELRYIRGRLDEVRFSTVTETSIITSTVVPFGSFGSVGGRHVFPGRGVRRPDVFEPRTGAQLSGRVGFGVGAPRGHVFLNPGTFPRRRPFGGGPTLEFPAEAIYGHFGHYGQIGQSYDFSYERSALITQFNELAAARAGLNARWRELEDEARRAGAPPGWLRR